MSTLQAHKTGGYRVDAEGAAGGQLIPVAVSENQRAELRETPYVRQLTGGGGKPGQGYATVRESAGVRRLTPIECERLMSWPDDWTAIDGEKTPDSRRYAACGDGVVSNVAEWIGRGIIREDKA